MKKKIPVVKQVGQTECGLACCTMVLNYYDSKVNISDLQKELDVGRDGLSIGQMKNFLIGKGLDARVYKVPNLNNLLNYEIPIITFWENRHFIVVESLNTGKVIVNDPAIGRKELSYAEFYRGFSNYILIAQPTDDFVPQKKSKEQPWLYLLKQLKEKWGLIVLLLAAMLGTYFITLYVTDIIQRVMDDIIKYPNMSVVKKYASIIGGVILLYLTMSLLKITKLVGLNVFLSEKLESDTFKKLLSLPYNFFEKRGSGDIMYKIYCATAIKEIIVSQLLSGIIDFGSIVVMGSYMFRKSYMLATLTIIIAILQLLFLIMINPKLKETIDEENIEKSKAYGLQMEAINSIASIKIAALEKDMFNNWKNTFNNSMIKFKQKVKYVNFETIIMNMIHIFAPCIILIVGIMLFLENKMSLGEVVAFQSIASMFFGMISSIYNAYTQFVTADTYARKLNEIWYAELPCDNGNVKREISGDIVLKNVSFSYTKNARNVIKNIDMFIGKGQKVAIVGESGSGKSTLGKIIIGLFKPNDGEILYDGINLNEYDRKYLTKQMGIVPQDAVLFNKSVKDNITLNDDNITFKEVKQAAKIACIDKEIEKMPMKYETIISDMGQNLSGGQRQRLLIARALVKKPKILFMDEATSALDNLNEESISNYLSNQGCTRIIIAHRLSTIIDADIIYMMKNGEIIGKGTHKELLETCLEYNNLYNKKLELKSNIA